MLLRGQAGSLRVHNTTVKVFMKISEVPEIALFNPASSQTRVIPFIALTKIMFRIVDFHFLFQ